ncbi:MAG: hypothetical protein ACXV7D_17085, partial [Thermoanaerobaculia bacterium]
GGFGSAALWTSLYGRWLGGIFACGLILLIAAWYLSKEQVPRFWSRFAITASSYVLAMAILIAIMYLNWPSSMRSSRLWPWIGPRLTVGLVGGCLLSFLVARRTAPEPEPAAG